MPLKSEYPQYPRIIPAARAGGVRRTTGRTPARRPPVCIDVTVDVGHCVTVGDGARALASSYYVVARGHGVMPMSAADRARLISKDKLSKTGFKVGKIVGHGSQAMVYAALNKKSGEMAAVKSYEKKKADFSEEELLLEARSGHASPSGSLRAHPVQQHDSTPTATGRRHGALPAPWGCCAEERARDQEDLRRTAGALPGWRVARHDQPARWCFLLPHSSPPGLSLRLTG